MINQINLSDIRSFVLIAELGNFTKAAEALDVSRSHISKQISQLEKQMGVTLLIRTTRTLKLTLAGEKLFQQCKNHLQGLNHALLAALDDKEHIGGQIKINCIGGFLGEEIIANILTDFMLKYPSITLEMDFSSHKVDLIQDDFDIAFRMGELEDAGFIGQKLLSLKMLTLASPQYLNYASAPLQHPKDLLNHNCLTGSVKKWYYQQTEIPSNTMEVSVKGNFQCKNGRALVNTAIAGCGIIRVPRIYCDTQVKQGILTKVMPGWDIPEVPFSIIYHKDRYQPTRLRLLITHIQKAFAEIRKSLG